MSSVFLLYGDDIAVVPYFISVFLYGKDEYFLTQAAAKEYIQRLMLSSGWRCCKLYDLEECLLFWPSLFDLSGMIMRHTIPLWIFRPLQVYGVFRTAGT